MSDQHIPREVQVCVDEIKSAIDAAIDEIRTERDANEHSCLKNQVIIAEKDKEIERLNAKIDRMRAALDDEMWRGSDMARLLDKMDHGRFTGDVGTAVCGTTDCPRCAWEKMKQEAKK